ATESFTSASPRVEPATRWKNARLLREAGSPYAMTMLPTTNEARKSNIVPPMLATTETAARAKLPILGCRLCTNPGKSPYAFDQTSNRVFPTTGQFFTPSRGGGTCNVFCWTAPTKLRIESAKEFINNQVGTTISKRASSTRIVEANPCLPPSL